MSLLDIFIFVLGVRLILVSEVLNNKVSRIFSFQQKLCSTDVFNALDEIM